MESWDELSPYGILVRTDDIKPRRYQIDIVKSVCRGGNTLVVLPTGLGKTLIATFIIAKALGEGRRALFMAPTKPLSEQHHSSLSGLLKIDTVELALFTGSLGVAKRRALGGSAKVIVATPQTIANDLRSERLSLHDFGVVIFDECHKAVGRYAYTYIAEEARLRGIQIVGLTASPGSNKKRVEALIKALGIDSIEARSSSDPDVEPYIPGKEVEVIRIDKGRTIDSIIALLRPLMDKHLANLYSHGLSPFRSVENLPRGRLLEIGRSIDKIKATGYKYMAVYDYVYLLNLSHAYDLVATEGLYPFISYIDSLEARPEKGKSVRSMLANPSVIDALRIAREAERNGEEHPKIPFLVGMIKARLEGKSFIVFAQYRSTIEKITKVLNLNGISARAFVGKKAGTTKDDQARTISDFREGRFRALVATSIGEEGLDIPTVDAVVFYEPVPNEIRNIQRKGRTGRIRFGSVIILVAKDTKDEKYLMVARLRERRMMDLLAKFKRELEYGKRTGGMEDAGQRRL
jgi:Fanconi anemia group M protein